MGTSGKKIAVYNAETGEKICQADNAHGKGVLKIVVLPESHEADFMSCSSDNLIKTWKVNEESKELEHHTTMKQVDEDAEEISRQALGMVCYE